MYNEEIELAKQARLNAYSPYNKFTVGAALRTKSGKIYTGCNIDNQGIQGLCAERTAFVKALSEGEKEFDRITVVGGFIDQEPKGICPPCGYCRQFMSEFVNKDFKIILVEENGNIKELTMEELLPYNFEV